MRDADLRLIWWSLQAGRGCSTHLSLWGAAFISDEQQVRLAVHHDLLFKAPSCRRRQPGSELQERTNTCTAVLRALVGRDGWINGVIDEC